MIHAAAITPKDDYISWAWFAVILAATILAAWLFRDTNRRGRNATSAAVTTRQPGWVDERPETDGPFPTCTTTGCPRPAARDGHCLRHLPYDQEKAA